MANFTYLALEKEGKRTKGVINALDYPDCKKILREKGLYPVSVKRIEKSYFQSRVKEGEFADALRELSTLINSHISLPLSLEMVVNQSKEGKLKESFSKTLDLVKEGSSLARAFSSSKIFPPLLISMVSAGEASGSLPAILSKFADYLEEKRSLRQKVVSLLTYPALLTMVSFGILIFLFTFLLPSLLRIFSNANLRLPGITLFLLSIVNFLKVFWFPLFLFLLSAFFGLLFYFRSERGKEISGKLALKIPLFSNFVQKREVANFCSTLSTLREGGVELLSSFDLLSQTMRNSVFKKATLQIKEDLSRGLDLSLSMGKTNLFPERVIQLVVAGERTNRLEEMLKKISSLYERELEQITLRFVSLLEPVLIIFLGIGVGIIVLSVLLPIFNLSQAIR